MADEHRYSQRTVEWGHWGITFLSPRPDRTKNFGVIAGYVSFPVSSQGPCDSGSHRERFMQMCEAWIERGELPVSDKSFQAAS